MLAFRSLLFNAVFFGFGFVFAVALLPFLILPRPAMQWGLKLWSGFMMGALKLIVGLDWHVKGLDNLPDRPAIFASKHQSAWETGIFYHVVDDPSYILKKELLAIPFFGWFIAHGGAIAIDRKAGASALKAMIQGAQDRIGRGQNVVIFPEGTRSAPRQTRHLPPGRGGALQGGGRAGGAGGAELRPVLAAAQLPQAARTHHHRIPAAHRTGAGPQGLHEDPASAGRNRDQPPDR